MKTLKVNYDVPLSRINEDRPDLLELMAEELAVLADMSKGVFPPAPPWETNLDADTFNRGAAALSLALIAGYAADIAKMNGLRISKAGS